MTTSTTFTTVNKTITFLKPELKLLLSDIYTQRVPLLEARRNSIAAGATWIPQRFISFVDIWDPTWAKEKYSRFFDENFKTSKEEAYDIIECRNDQLDLVNELCHEIGVYPEVLIIHSEESTVKLFSDKVSFFIVKGIPANVLDIELTPFGSNGQDTTPSERRSLTDPNLIIYHPACEVRFIVNGVSVRPNFTHGKDRFLPWDDEMFTRPGKPDEFICGRFRQSDCPKGKGLDATIVHFGIRDSPVAVEKAEYIIFDGYSRQANPRFASVITDSTYRINVADNIPDNSSKFLIVHGRPMFLGLRASNRMSVFFPDMSQAEINSIWKNSGMLYGNDRDYVTELEKGIVKNPKISNLYFHDKITFGQFVLDRFCVNRIAGLSYIDDYLGTLVLKTPIGRFRGDPKDSEYQTKCVQYLKRGFHLMIARFGTALGNEAEKYLGGKDLTRELIGIVQDRVREESKLATQRRTFILQRIEQLSTKPGPIFPYQSELAVGEPLLEEEEEFRKKIKAHAYDPMTRPHEYYLVSTPKDQTDETRWDRFVGKDYIVLTGTNYRCILNKCGFVILAGTGRVKICGTVHSIVIAGEVEVILDNISPLDFDPETYIYIENGSIFDTIVNYRDNLTPDEIHTLIDSIPKQEEGVYKSLENNPPMPEPRQSVIKNVYHRGTLPRNHLSAMIENFIAVPDIEPEP